MQTAEFLQTAEFMKSTVRWHWLAI